METPETVNLFLGFDPGGAHVSSCKGHFGWSICQEVDGSLQPCPITGLAKDAWDAINQANCEINIRYPQGNFHVMAAGIDAPLLWNKRGDKKGYRKAEVILRKVLRETKGPRKSVVAPNGLYGSVGMQGPLLARHLNEKWDLLITESHPKVFRHLLSRVNQPYLVQTANCLTGGLSNRKSCEKGHENDATLGAMSAWAAIRCRRYPCWKNLYKGDPNLFNPSGIPVSYWMPIPV